jgi:DNA-binding transcriptional ArsR family regulator
VARSVRRDWKLWTGKSSSVRLLAAFCRACSERVALATTELRAASAAGRSWSSNSREMNASKLADYVGVPRSTVQRRLEELEQLGRVERRGTTWRTPLKALARAEEYDLAAIADMIKESLDQLG